MGLNYRKRIRLSKNSGLNLSKSGISFSQKAGPFTFNSRGRTTVRLGNGWSYTMSGAGCGCLVALIVLFVLARFFWFFLAVGLVGWLLWKAWRA